MAEIAIALGIAAFCLITVFGLLQVGLTSNQNSLGQTAAASLVSAVAADLRAAPPLVSGSTSSQTPVFQIALPSAAGQTISHVYFAEDSSRTSPGAANARYLASVGMTPPASGRRGTTAVRILVTWPAAMNADALPNQWPARSGGFLEAFMALNRN